MTEQSLKDKRIIITGGSSGIGAAAARALSRLGAKVVITGRSEQTKKLAEELKADYFLVDFSDFSDVKRFASNLLDKYPVIDVLVNNVGGVFANRTLTKDGHEMTLQVNHLSGFLLTQLLKNRLEESKALVINTSSLAHLYGKIDLQDLESEKSFSGFKVYGAAKMMNLLHAMEINKRFKGVTATSFHPGMVKTDFAREGSSILKFIYQTPLKHLFMITSEEAAETLVWLIQGRPGKDWQPGEFYNKRIPGKKNPQVSENLAQNLWEASEKLSLISHP